MAKNDFAIVIGISRYSRPGMAPLNGPENDARDFRDWLADPLKGNVSPEHIFSVLSSDTIFGDDQPYAEQIEDRFVELKQAIDTWITENSRPRRLYIFMAGHGFSWAAENAALLAANGDYDELFRRKHVAGRRIAEWFRNAGLCEEIVLLMDCCRTDGQGTEPRQLFTDKTSNFKANVKIFYGFATASGALARERKLPSGKVIDGTNGATVENGNNTNSNGSNGDKEEVRGLFTYALLEGLEHAERDEQGRIMGASLDTFIKKKMGELTADNPQRPYIEITPIDAIEWVRKAGPAPNRVRISISPKQNVQVEIEDPDLTLIIGSFPDNQPIQLDALPGGIYNLRWPSGHEEAFEVVGSNRDIGIAVNLQAPPESRVMYV